jgi:hypothetical protein
MSTLHVNTLDTQSGTDIAIQTGKTLTGTAAQFKITGGTNQQLIQTDGAGGLSFVNSPGANNVMNKNQTYSLTTADVAGTPTTIVTVQASTGNTIISLPTPTDMQGRVVRVVVTAINFSAPYFVRVTDSTGMNELWSGSFAHDYAEFTSDGTTINVIDWQTTIKGQMRLTSNWSAGATEKMFQSANNTTYDENVGNWMATNGTMTAQFDCEMYVEWDAQHGYTSHGEGAGLGWKKNGSWLMDMRSQTGMGHYNWFSMSANMIVPLAKDDTLEWWTATAGGSVWYGDAAGTYNRGRWHIIRRNAS